ncbi:MAG: AzlD domain-containing protein [Clostridiales bacterium]|nr:AzlD domain-containing protein [Clostridiales bacterium]MCF8023346.1 AzlD domain-containing protein [Clostridiales bacterium]
MDTKIWLIIAGMAVVTFIPRIFPFFLINGNNLPPVLKEWLRLLPIVIFASMITPPLLLNKGSINPGAHLEEIIVVLTAAVTAYFTKKIPLCLGAAVIMVIITSAV